MDAAGENSSCVESSEGKVARFLWVESSFFYGGVFVFVVFSIEHTNMAVRFRSALNNGTVSGEREKTINLNVSKTFFPPSSGFMSVFAGT